MSDLTDPQKVIEAAADSYGVDMERAVVAQDPDPESSRIYILEELPEEYRLISYGLDADGNTGTEEPIHIPISAVGELQGLLHAAGLHQAHDSLIDGSTTLRDISEGMGVSEPLQPDGGDQ